MTLTNISAICWIVLLVHRTSQWQTSSMPFDWNLQTPDPDPDMYLNGPSIRKALPLPSLLEVLSDLFQRYSEQDPTLQQPIRSVLSINDQQNVLLNLPCIDTQRGYMCVKTITSFPDSHPAIDGAVSLFDAKNGRLLLIADAKEITAQRTAAVSFLATKLLALPRWTDDQREQACLTILGCGVQGRAHLEVFSQLHLWKKIYLWSRNSAHAKKLQSEFSSTLTNIELLTDLNDPRIQQSDVICTCTASEEALIGLNQVKAGVHINAVGSFRVTMRELADDLMLASTSSIVVDSRESALKEAGEIIQSKAKIAAELGELVSNDRLRTQVSQGNNTIFKSVGIAIEDLAAAIVLHELGTSD